MRTKKIFLLGIGLSLVLALVACGGQSEEEQSPPQQQESLEHEDVGLPPLEDVFEDLRKELENEKITDHFESQLETFKEESDIVIHEDGDVFISVNDAELSMEEFESELEDAKQMMIQQMAMQGGEIDPDSEEIKSYLDMLKEDIRDNFIYSELQKQLLEQGDYDVTEDEIEVEIEAFKNQFNSEEDFEGFLLDYQTSEEELGLMLESQLEKRKFVQDMGLDYDVSDQEVEETYEMILQQQQMQQQQMEQQQMEQQQQEMQQPDFDTEDVQIVE